MNDPVKGCDVYKEIGCAHVDGFLCDYPNCSILKDYKMNERIKELAQQAGFSFKYKTAPDEMNPGHKLKHLEKFADLIVRECMSICDESRTSYQMHRKSAFDFDEKNIYAEGEAASDSIKYNMKRRFGV